jgi:hypothetical protein
VKICANLLNKISSLVEEDLMALKVAAADSQEVAGRFNGAENIIINNF